MDLGCIARSNDKLSRVYNFGVAEDLSKKKKKNQCIRPFKGVSRAAWVDIRISSASLITTPRAQTPCETRVCPLELYVRRQSGCKYQA